MTGSACHSSSQETGPPALWASAWLVSVAVAVASPLAGQIAPRGDLVVTEIWSSESVDWTQPLSEVSGVVETAPGVIWISDSSPGSGRLVMVREAGGAETVVGRPGEGPGEIRSAGLLAVTTQGNVVMYDIAGIAVMEYSATGESLRRIRLLVQVRWPKGFVVLASGDFVVSGPVLGIGHAIHRFSQVGRLVESWGEPAEARNWRARMIATGGPMFALGNGSVLYSQGTPHRVVQYLPSDGSMSGWHERPIATMSEMFQSPGDGVIVETIEDGEPIRSFYVTYPQSRGVFEMTGGSVLNVVVMSDEGRSVWQLFDGPGELVAETEVAQAYRPWFKCEDGNILASRRDATTDEWVVVRLRVDVSSPAESFPVRQEPTLGSVAPYRMPSIKPKE